MPIPGCDDWRRAGFNKKEGRSGGTARRADDDHEEERGRDPRLAFSLLKGFTHCLGLFLLKVLT
jgi:hypothetical protein